MRWPRRRHALFFRYSVAGIDKAPAEPVSRHSTRRGANVGLSLRPRMRATRGVECVAVLGMQGRPGVTADLLHLTPTELRTLRAKAEARLEALKAQGVGEVVSALSSRDT